MTSAVEDMAVKATKGRIYPWDFDRKGKLPVWTLLNRMEYLGSSQRLFFKADNDIKDIKQAMASLKQSMAYEMRFVRCQSVQFSPDFYELMEFPGRAIRVEARVIFVGKTSWVYETKILDRTTEKELATRHVQTVNIDKKTRRPKSLPDWVTERYSHLTSLPRPTTVQPFDLSDAEPAFVYPVTVAPSDIDANMHTNQSQYARYCFNCAATGAKKGAYSIISGDLLDYDVISVDLLYQKESREGDSLRVESWEDAKEPDTLKFQVKRGEDNILQCKMRFRIPSVPDIEKAKL
ncbi:Hypp6312 [Branchiostoma lanceolatum]|uniref:Hypp6312 protein n=1 Tax=Branchiostoma lanceolatum TaxID=7740 RepID=A0A8J9YSY0_BRALA|nr:Hypp6312 [Branchiostoma lanceolatum]CAH1241127.1 Hypp6312 [Branchiostoma lanceolatum]